MAKTIDVVRTLCVTAIVSLLAQSVLAATPVVYWDSDFKTDTKIGTNNDTYTLVVNGNSVENDTKGSFVTIADTERKGVYINWSTTTDAATILVKYSGLTTDDKTYPMGLLGFSKASQDNVDGLAVHSSSRNVKAYWNGNYAYSMTNPEPTLTMDGTCTKLALKYSNGGTHSRVSYNGGNWSNLYTRNNIMGNNTYAMNGAVVGGTRALTAGGSDFHVAKGMQITGIAIFNSVLSDDDIADYSFPSESIVADPVAKIGGVGYETLADAITAAGAATTTITLVKSATEDVTIPANVTVMTTKTNALSGTVDGVGTIVYDAESTSELSAPTLKNTWSGKVHLKNIAQASGYYQLPFNSLGNAASMVALENVTGYVAGGAINPTVELVGEGWNLNAGGSSNVTTIKLAGSGTLTIPAGCTATQVVKVTNTDFVGNISNAGNISVVFGEAGGNYDKNTYKTTIYVASGKTIAVGSGKTWAANNGIIVDGELTVNGNISSGLKGAGKVAMNGFPTNQSVLDSLANSAWKGTLSIASIEKTGEINLAPYGNASSTLEINGLTGATRYLKNGSNLPFTLKVSGDLTFNQGSSSTTYTIAKVSGSGNLSFLNWSGSSNNDANHGYTITKLEGYTGTLTTTRFTTITELALETEPDIGDKLVTLGSGSQNTIKVTKVTVGGEPLDAAKRVEIRTDGIYCISGEVTTEETMEVFGVKNVDIIRIGNGGVQKFAGTAGIRTTELTIKNGGKLVNDPIKNPIYVTGGAPTLQDGAKIALAEKYAAYTKGVFTLMTWDGDTTSTTVIPEGLFEATEAQQTNGPKLSLETYTTHVDNSKGTAKTYTALKLDLDPNGVKPKLKIMPLGDSITEGSNPDGLANPNYRVILMAKMASLGYDISSTGMRMIKNWNAAGIYQPMEWSWHSGVSGQTLVSTGSRAGWRDSLEAMLDASEIPDIITFKIGTNDSLASRNIDQTVAEWVEVMRRIIKARPSTKIIVGSIMPFQGGGTWGSGENSWNAKLKKAIEENTYDFPEGQVFYAPLAENCLRTMDGKDNFVDSLHPNWTGHERNAETWATTITAALTAYPSAPGTYAPNEKLGAAENVGADYIKGFTKLAAYSPDNTVIAKDGEINYSFKLAGLDTAAITKVGYYMELKNERSGNVRWVWADMDNWNEDKFFSNIAIPTAYTYCGSAQNLHVDSNDEGIEKIAPTVSGKTAWLQFTRGDLLKDTAAEGAPAAYSPRDWNDACDDSGNYGVMNLYRVAPTAVEGGVNALPAQVLMAYSRWTSDKQQIGVGNFMVHGQPLVYGNINDMPVNYYGTQDFERLNLSSYTVANIEIWGKVDAEAKIGDTYYKTLQDAITAAENAQTITIIGDVSSEKVTIENKVIYISGAINGRNVDCECEVPMKNGDMLFGDLEMAVAEVTSKGYSPFVVDKSVLFKMHKGVKIESDIVLPPYANTNSAIYFDATYCGMDEQTLDLNGHTISQTQGGPGGYWWSSVHVNCATVKIVDTSKEQTGKITGIGSCITITGYDEYQGYSLPAQVTLASGTLTVTGKPQKSGSNTYYAENGIVGIFYSGKFIMTGGKIDAVADLDPNGKVAGVIADGANTTYGKPSVTITGGEIIGVPLDHQIARKPGIPLSMDGIFAGAIVSEKTIKISGGTFSSPLNLEYCADDCYPTVINGVYGVCTDPVAKIGDMYYTTLQGAADAAANGDTIELLAEAHIEGLSVSGKAVIIVHTKTVSGTTQYFLKLGSAYIGEQKDSGAIPLLNSVDVPGGDKISPAVDAECVTKYTYSSGDHTWKQPIVVGDLTKCVAIATGSEYIPTTTKKPYLISYFISKNITLEDDMELPLRTTISGSLNFCGDNLVFDLNGHTLKQGVYVNGYPAVAVKAGSLTIKDSVGTGKIIGATNGLNIENGAQCVVESGSIMTMGCWNEKVHGSCVIAQNDAELTIKGGVFGDDSFYVDNPKTDGTLWAMNATVSITGGEFRAPTNEDAWDGTAICAYSYTVGKTASVTISGDPMVYGWVYPYQAAGSAAMSISGGQFDTPVNKYYGKLTVDGYEVVINDNGLYEPLPKTPDLEITVSKDGKTITPSVTSEGTAVVVNQETLEETEELPQETGLYGVIVKNVAGKSTGTSLIGVIKVEEKSLEKKTIAVAVPFTGATVANLLNTALLNEGDTLTAYLHTGYETWTLTDGKWVGLSMTRAGGEPSNGLPDSTLLVRGQAVWVTTAGQVVVLGTYDDSTEIAKADEAVNLLANPTMKDYKVPISDVDTEVFNVGDLSAVYKVVKDSQTQEDVWQCTESVTTIKNGVPMTKPVISKKAPSIKVGKGYWLRKAKESK